MLVERPLTNLAPASQQPSDAFKLTNEQGFEWSLSFLTPTIYKITVVGPNHPLPQQSNVHWSNKPLAVSAKVDTGAQKATLSVDGLAHEVTVQFDDTPIVEIHETVEGSNDKVRIFGDNPHKSYCYSETGVTRYTRFNNQNLHIGMGEKAAPLDLTHRSFCISGSDSASYDAYRTDPLYKHTPFLMSLPKPFDADGEPQPLTSVVGIYSASNSDANWDVGRFIDEPWGMFKKYAQHYGGLEEYIILGEQAQQVVTQFSDLVGRPLLVPRDWLGYLASGMGLGESDVPIAQELLSGFPGTCKQHDIPCSAIHLSSGYTVDGEGNRLVFTMNTRRYPDFAELVKTFHKAGIRVTPNIKPYVAQAHPHYQKLYDAGALFTDPNNGNKPVVTRIWSSGIGCTALGSWVDLTSKAGREWWRQGALELCKLGVDSLWNDNNEFLLFDDAFICKNELDGDAKVDGNRTGKPTPVGALGRMTNTELMARESHQALVTQHPDRRPFVLTRSANVGTQKWAASTWSGDNRTSWHNLRGSIAMGLNAQMSLMQSYGNDIGGFAGPLPSPELFVRWIQSGITQPRFCIHSFKPCKEDPTGVKLNNLPWMYPEVVDIIRTTIKRRYELLPFINNLNWRSHLAAEPMNTWLGWNEFAADPNVYSREVLEGFDYWIGHGQLLVAGAYHENELTRRVYLPAAGKEDTKVYYDTHSPFKVYKSGQWVENVSTPLSHFAVFAREGTVVPVGLGKVTITQNEGPATITCSGTKILTEQEGGQCVYDDWRGIEVFPSPVDAKSPSEYTYSWIEDDGVSAKPAVAEFKVDISSSQDEVSVKASATKSDFKPLWGNTLWVILPRADTRKVQGASKTMLYKGQTAYAITVSGL
ncbi:Glycoside hydrolase, family 31 [Kalmanozyma brasiliensis GHG001]|uniref:Glycoside hydrolase n=1 Tax=Kalmanozyma brasiliensis (strain GHG001) TaxID=1365824 RepID=V5GPK9_KALBG|nr:Glycoside hydrolase, family 31 [Kalmanozyma brasiliensis GHG001]EST07897.1 Glycoside hydrolase, family 31 [Kalmanozyma brasiliensis GHG001]